MALSDCIKCWDTPCICGWGYRHFTTKMLKNKILLLSGVLKYKTDHPDAEWSGILGVGFETEDDKALMKMLKEDWNND